MIKHRSIGDRTADIFIALVLILICLTTLYPFWYLFTLSFTSGDVSLTRMYLIPPKLTLENYAKVLSDGAILTGFINTIIRTVLGTVIAVSCTILTAYPLSRKELVHKKFFTSFVIITMFVSGGTIPSYLLVKTLGLMDTIWALVLPTAISAYNVIIARNFFISIPDSLVESAKIDGANDLVILWKVVIPVSLPIIATITLWIAVAHWNAWFDSLIYTQSASKQVLQVVMRRIILEGTQDMMNPDAAEEAMHVNTETIKATTVIVATVPILVVYPFIQKYFVKGVMIGAVKG